MMEPPVPQPFAWAMEPFGPVLRSLQLAGAASHFFTTRALAPGERDAQHPGDPIPHHGVAFPSSDSRASESSEQLRLRGAGAAAQWARLADAIGVVPGRLARLKQVHGSDIVIIRSSGCLPGAEAVADRAGRLAFRLGTADDRMAVHLGDGLPRADVLMTDDPDTAIAVQTADCVPVLIADTRSGAVAAVHAGWRGTAARVVTQTVSAFVREFASGPEHLVAAIGPSIGPCCYQVGPDVVDAFRIAGFGEAEIRRWFKAEAEGDRLRLDVASANRDLMTAAGVSRDRIAECRLCTACHPSFFHSYRREGTTTGRLAAVIRPTRAAR